MLNSTNFDFLKNLIRYAYFQGSTTTIKFEIYNIIKDVCAKKEINSYVEDIVENNFNSLGGLKFGYALLAFYLKRHVALRSFNIDKLVTYKDEKYLSESWTIEEIKKIDNQIGNFVVLDIPKKNITIDKKVNYYNTSMLDEVKDLSIKLSNSFSLENFQTRNEELKKIIIDFFQGKI